jgi:hypothetical protein
MPNGPSHCARPRLYPRIGPKRINDLGGAEIRCEVPPWVGSDAHHLAANVCLGAARHREADRWLEATRGLSVYGREGAQPPLRGDFGIDCQITLLYRVLHRHWSPVSK